MRKYLIIYLLIIALLTGCSVQSTPEQIEAGQTNAESQCFYSISISKYKTN